MRLPRARFVVRWVLPAFLLAGVLAMMAAFEQRERVRSERAISAAGTAYQRSTLARERAELAVKDYTDGTYRQELAAVVSELNQAQDQLIRVTTTLDPAQEWAEYIKSKGYLLLVNGAQSRTLALTKAMFAVEQARSKKLVLTEYTRGKTLADLNNRVAKARLDESARKAEFDKAKATPAGLIRKVMRRIWPP
jgi:hypothetical protein